MLIIDKTLGKRIAYYRKELNLSRSKLATIVGMEDNHLYRIETGLNYPRINLIARLAVVFGVSIDELVRGMERPMDMYENDSEDGSYMHFYLNSQYMSVDKNDDNFTILIQMKLNRYG